MPFAIKFHVYLATRTRWAHFVKVVPMPVVPRTGEFVKFDHPEELDYYPFEVVQVTYRESGAIEVMTELVDNIDGRWYSFEDEGELDECVDAYVRSGWDCPRGIGPNRRILAVRRGPDGG